MRADAILIDHARGYVHAVMKEQLVQAGFISKDKTDLHWYRLTNDDVIHSVYFFSSSKNLPVLLELAYGCHPAFIAPEYPSGLRMRSARHSMELRCWERMILKEQNQAVYSQQIAVSCPDDVYKGADILEKMLLRYGEVNTVEECYRMHKAAYVRIAEIMGTAKENTFKHLSLEFIDEMISQEDVELYPYAIAYIDHCLSCVERAKKVRELCAAEKENAAAFQKQRTILLDGDRNAYLAELEQRKKLNIQKIKRVLKL